MSTGPPKQYLLSPTEVTILPEGKSSHYYLWLGTIKHNNQTLNGPCPRFHHRPSWHLFHLHPSAYPIPLYWSSCPLLALTLSNLHCGCAQSLSHVWLCVTPWTVAHQAPLSMGFSRQECIPFSSGHSWPRDQPQVSCIAGEFFTDRATWSQLPEINYFSLPWIAPHSSLSFFLWKKVQQWSFMETPVSSLILSSLTVQCLDCSPNPSFSPRAMPVSLSPDTLSYFC